MTQPTLPGGERRLWPRRPKQIAVFVADPDDALGEPYRGRVVDRSRSGLGLEVALPDAAAGSVLKVRPVSAPRGTPWVEVRVTNCRRVAGGRAELGCVFLEKQSYKAILLLG